MPSMLSQVQPLSNQEYRGPAPTKIILSQEQYRLCQIRVPDLEQSVPAVYVDDEYYSFFRSVKEADKTLEITAKLGTRGDSTVITKIPKGYIIWVKEAVAEEVRKPPSLNV